MRADCVWPGLKHRQDGVVGGHHMRLPHPLRHPLVQRLDHIGDISTPHRLCGPGNLKTLPFENILQPIQREVICKFAGNNESEQSRTGKALLDRCLRFGRCLDLGIFAGLFATGAGILLAHMPQALEMAGEVFDLPALLAADLLSLLAAARTASLFCCQLIDVRADRKMFEIR